METLFHKCKMVHAVRVLKCTPDKKKKINRDDLYNGYELFLKSREENEKGMSKECKNMYI